MLQPLCSTRNMAGDRHHWIHRIYNRLAVKDGLHVDSSRLVHLQLGFLNFVQAPFRKSEPTLTFPPSLTDKHDWKGMESFLEME